MRYHMYMFWRFDDFGEDLSLWIMVNWRLIGPHGTEVLVGYSAEVCRLLRKVFEHLWKVFTNVITCVIRSILKFDLIVETDYFT